MKDINVWSINKALAIKHFLLELIHCYGKDKFCLDPYSQQFEAVEIYLRSCPDISAYIYTFAQPIGRYAIDLKYPDQTNNIIGENENISLDQLLSIITIHFELTDD